MRFEALGLAKNLRTPRAPRGEGEEQAIQKQFNDGVLKKGDVHNEFYPIEEWPKIYRDLMTHQKEMLLRIDYPPASGHEKARKTCCGGRE